MNDYDEIDEKIISALSEEEAKYYKELDEQSLPQQVFGIYKGKLGWVSAAMTIIMIPAFVISVYAGIEFFQSSDLVAMMKSGAVMFIGMFFLCMLKLFSWNQMDKNNLIRELKRLEYQISLLDKNA